MLFNFIKDVRDVKRFNQILVVLFEEGFDFLISKIRLRHQIPLANRLKSKLKKDKELKHEVMLRRTLERLGPTFIKLGQVLSVRPDLVPKDYIKELEKLQDSVPEFQFEEAREIIEKEFGKKLERVFLHFEKKPIASASISQVYKATLRNGDKVAVKVQRPDVRKMMETDIEIMFYFAHLLENYIEKIKSFDPVRIVSEFRDWTEKELDFRIEARNAKRFGLNFKDSKTVKIPKVYDEFSAEKVLTLEFIEGTELHNIKILKKDKASFAQIISNGFNAIMTQVFVHGIFHGDPHPGNIIVMRDNTIGFVDFGIVGYFDQKLRSKFIDLLYGIVEQDIDVIVDTLISLGMQNEEINYAQLKSDIGFLIQPLQGATLSEIKISKILEDIMDIALIHKLKMPPSFVLLGKTIITFEGVALEYDPDFKFVETTKPFIEKLMAKRASPLYMWKNFMHEMRSYAKFAETLPEKAEKALDKIQKGSIKIDVEDTDIKKLALEIDKSSNRIAYGLLITALLITSAILVQVEKGPTILGVPFLSFFSFFFASVLGMVLFVSIVREKLWHW